MTRNEMVKLSAQAAFRDVCIKRCSAYASDVSSCYYRKSGICQDFRTYANAYYTALRENIK